LSTGFDKNLYEKPRNVTTTDMYEKLERKLPRWKSLATIKQDWEASGLTGLEEKLLREVPVAM
jgi:hypothetical protein